MEERQIKPVATLSIAFYKKLDVLCLTLASVEVQTLPHFSVTICDDGTDQETIKKLHQELDQMRIPVLHLWHEDLGFRKNRILNWGLHYCPSDYVIFIDQDCILHPEFMHEHFDNRVADGVLCGRRMDFTPWVTALLTPERVRSGFIQKNLWWMIILGAYMKDNNGPKGIYITWSWLRKLVNQKPRSIVGCNFSVSRQHLLDINGFDFRYEGAGIGEDSDIDFRLQLKGIRMIPFCNTAVQYHQYHSLLSRPNENEVIFDNVKKAQQSTTGFGLKEQLVGN